MKHQIFIYFFLFFIFTTALKTEGFFFFTISCCCAWSKIFIAFWERITVFLSSVNINNPIACDTTFVSFTANLNKDVSHTELQERILPFRKLHLCQQIFKIPLTVICSRGMNFLNWRIVTYYETFSKAVRTIYRKMLLNNGFPVSKQDLFVFSNSCNILFIC